MQFWGEINEPDARILMSMLYFLDRPEAMTFPGLNVEP